MNEIETDRLDRVIRKALGIRAGTVAPTVAPEITPAIVIEQERPEWRYLAGERLFFRGLYQAAVVGNYSYVGLYVPLPRWQAIVEEVIISSSASVNNRVGLASGVEVVGAGGYPRDDRYYGLPGIAEVYGSSRLGALPVGVMTSAPVSQEIHIRGPWLLTYTQPIRVSLVVCTNAPNLDVTASFIWRERLITSDEL